MARKCITGKGIQVGHRVSHSNIKSKHRFYPNLQKKRFWSLEEKKFVSLRVSTNAIRTIDKIGLDAFLRLTKKAAGKKAVTPKAKAKTVKAKTTAKTATKKA
jgi:large subunit ribosomal protein L28